MSRRKLKTGAGALLLLLLIVLAARFTDCSLPALWARRSHLTDIAKQMIPPDWAYFPRILFPLWATVQMSVTGTALGAFLALLLSPLCAMNLQAPRLPRRFLRCLIQILRSFPALILALTGTFLFGIGVFAGTFAITAYTFAIMTRLTYEDLETAGLGPYKALTAMGTPPYRACFRALLPEIAPSYLSNTLYMLETNVRHSAILGYVGAGGIGLLLNEKVSWREYDRGGAILLALFLAVCLIEALSAALTDIVKGERHVGKTGRRLIVAALLLLFVVSTASVGGPDLSRSSFQTVKNMFLGLVNPDWAFFFRVGSAGLGYLLLETVCIALVGTAVGAVIALPLSLLGSGRLMPRPVALLFRLLVMAVRSIPFLIYGLIFIRATGPGAFTGVLTMAVCSVGLLSKRFTEALDTLDFRAYNALAAMGVPALLRIRYAVLPQLFPAFASAALYRFDVNLREASVLGLVGAGGIGAPLIFAMNHYSWPEAGAISLGLILLMWIVDGISSRLRRPVR